MKERIVIVSLERYPDIRIEREIYTLIKYGYEVILLSDIKDYECVVFKRKTSSLRCIKFKPDTLTYNLIEPWFTKTVLKVEKTLKILRPDIVLAINPVAGSIIKNTGYPMVIDNREYYYHKIRYTPLNIPSGGFCERVKYFVGSIRRKWIYWVKKLEAQLAEEHPMIFPSQEAAMDFAHRFHISLRHVYSLKNYPTLFEIQWTEEIKNKDWILFGYIGQDIVTKTPYRNLSITIETLCNMIKKSRTKVIVAGLDYSYKCFKGIGYLSLDNLYRLLSFVDFGIASWNPHKIHWYFSPNKVYQYAIAGTIPIIVSTLKSVLKDLKDVAMTIEACTNDSFRRNLKLLLGRILNMKMDEIIDRREKTMYLSRNKFIWDNQEINLLNSIKYAS